MKIKHRGKKFMRNGMISAPESKWTGEEPTWEGASEWEESKIYRTFSRALHFYNYYLDTDDYVPIILDYLKDKKPKDKISPKVIKKAPRCIEIVSCGKLARMINLGMPEKHGGKDYSSEIHSYIQRIGNKAPIEKKKETTTRKGPSVFDLVQEKLREGVLIYLEEMLDGWIVNETANVQKINVLSLLKGVGSPIGAVKCVSDWLEKQRAELIEARDKTCPQMVEGYSYLSKPAIKRRIKLLEDMLKDVELYKASKKAQQKPRVKKEKSADKLVERMKYLTSSPDYSVTSVNPIKIIGSEKVYLFNEKYRRLTVLESLDKDGLTVSGSSIKNFDEKKSFAISLRKPKDVLVLIITKTEKQIANAISKLTTKKSKANGRVNDNTIIIKA
jgi:hypothetical protein